MIQQCFFFFFSCTLPVCLLLNIVLVFCYLPDFLVGGKNGCVFVADGLSRTCFSYRAQTFGASLGDFTTQPITHSGVFFFPYWRYVYKDFWSGFRRWSESLFHVTLLQQPSCRWQSTAPKTINNTRAGKNWWIRSEKYKLNCRLFSWEHIAGYCPAVLISVSLCVSWEKASLGLNIGNRAREVIEGDQKIQLYSIHCMLSASDIYWKMCWQFFWFFLSTFRLLC